MIVVDEGSHFLLITQPDHAFFAVELLSLWRGGGLPDHPRREDLLFAIREHDNGWREVDAAPSVARESGRPLDFIGLPREARIEVWRRGTSRYAEERPYAAALITHHALALHRRRSSDPAWGEFLSELRERYEELESQLGTEATAIASDYRFLRLADEISLAACNRWSEPRERHGIRFRFDQETLFLDPFPLAGTTTFRIPSRRIAVRRYRGDADLGAELAAARWSHWRVRAAAETVPRADAGGCLREGSAW
ncbi:MAG: DUF3891 family protein [Thermoanaerobaculia bacterium]